MAYKIAAATSDGTRIDRSFRDVKDFYIFDVNERGEYVFSEVRSFDEETESEKENGDEPAGHCEQKSCGNGHGCGGANSPKLKLVEDCRCLICTQIGFKINKQLARKAIASFETDAPTQTAVEKIVRYYGRVDNHQSLKGL
jgi:hypothetical protein